MYISATPESMAALSERDANEPISMLTLVRYREIADYSECPDLTPDQPISGKQAYSLYSKHTIPLLAAVGGRTIFSAKGGSLLIGPPEVRWDHVLLIEYPNIQAFFDLIQNPEYLAGAGHRTAAIVDSRILPMT